MQYVDLAINQQIPSPANQYEKRTIVIVGAGSIGLSTAYNLAKSSSAASSSVKIIVIDPFDRPFAASSSQCTGCFHYGFPEKETQPLLPLGKYSFDLWAAHAGNEDFQKPTGYRPHSFFGVNQGSGNGIEALPDWIQSEQTWDVDEDVLGTRNATVNPTGIGQWLTAQCFKLGVEIKTNLKVIYADLSPENRIQAVVCLRKNLTTIRIDCTQLLLACGPWTPIVYKMLFPSSPIQLQSSTNAGDWIVCKNPCPTTQKTIAYVSFQGILAEKLEFAGRNDGTIWVCGRRDFTAPLPPPGQNAEPDERLIEELFGRAQTLLNSKCRCTRKHDDELQLLSKGRAFRPATQSGLPIMSEVTPSDLTSYPAQGSSSSSGVFVCWGHGSYGLTLSMGTGKLMGQLMCGEKPDLDLSLFSLRKDNNAAKNST
ncbi:MAG: hypothetical protein Q9170_003324 [Blastenia crenularia]